MSNRTGMHLLPLESLEVLRMYTNKDSKVECIADPKVYGVIALQITNKRRYPFHFTMDERW